MVDGSHWQSKIKNKFKNASQSSSSGGHTGCSDSYNFNAYKDFISEDQFAVNSQSREQMHSTLSKLSKSLRQKNLSNFMAYMKAFFAINNLTRMGKI